MSRPPSGAVDAGSPRRGFRGAIAFLTPVGGAARPSSAAVAWFPFVGAVVGLVLGGLWWVTARAWPASVVGALVVLADLGLTGMLHFDGLLDSADGLLAHLDRSRRLEVMASPEVGAFAVAVGGGVLLVRWATVASLAPAPLLLAALWCASRTLMAVVIRVVPYAREGGGLATAFLGPAGLAAVVVGGVAAFGLAAWWRPVAGPVAVVAGVIAGIGVVAVARKRLGGFTGDVLGAAGVIAETVGLIVASAKW
jgi:adenosylcobinamide-GDP ribazoletransferase